MNKIILTGRLTREPEQRATKTGKMVTSFTVAVDRPYKDEAGNKVTDFFNCFAWDKMSENVIKYVSKGQRIFVDGRMQLRSYTDKNGINKIAPEVICTSVEFLEPKSKEAKQQDELNRERFYGGPEQQSAFDNMGVRFDEEVPF